MRCREARERWEAEAADRTGRAEGREAEARRRDEELKREEAALIAANLELQARWSVLDYLVPCDGSACAHFKQRCHDRKAMRAIPTMQYVRSSQ